mgnify:CR=1 FL=1
MNINEAKKFFDDLYSRDLMYHLEDDAEDCLEGKVSKDEARKIQSQVDAIYNADLDWGEFECPIGYCLHVMNAKTLFTFR